MAWIVIPVGPVPVTLWLLSRSSVYFVSTLIGNIICRTDGSMVACDLYVLPAILIVASVNSSLATMETVASLPTGASIRPSVFVTASGGCCLYAGDWYR